MILADQLIPAKLNLANGAAPTPIQAIIEDADPVLSRVPCRLPYHVKTSSKADERWCMTPPCLVTTTTGF